MASASADSRAETRSRAPRFGFSAATGGSAHARLIMANTTRDDMGRILILDRNDEAPRAGSWKTPNSVAINIFPTSPGQGNPSSRIAAGIRATHGPGAMGELRV